MTKEIWAHIEIAGGKIVRASQEALSEAVRQGKQQRARTTAVVLGHAVSKEILEGIGRYGPDQVLVCEDEALGDYETDLHSACLQRFVQEHNPDLFLMGSSAVTRELAPRLATRLKSSLVTEATFLNRQGARTLVTRSAFRPHASMIVAPREEGLQIVTLAPKVVDSEEIGPAESYGVQRMGSAVEFKKTRVRVEEKIREIPSKLDITDAEIIVAGGKGMQNEEGFRLLDELAEVVGGTVGATRMAVDLKWRSRESLVGVTGKVVSPELYFACGISGAVQHVMGMRSSQAIVAINTDPNAPIFRIATLGIVGNANEVLPVMIESFRAARGKAETPGSAA